MAPLSAHQLSMTVLMSPDMANFSGNVHGGAILKLLDQAAYACAARYAGRYVVTLSVDQVTFLQPIHVGEPAAAAPLEPVTPDQKRRRAAARVERAICRGTAGWRFLIKQGASA